MKLRILILILLMFIFSLSPVHAGFEETVEFLLFENRTIISDETNSISIEKGNIYLTSAEGENIEIINNDTSQYYFITLVYLGREKKLLIYVNGERKNILDLHLYNVDFNLLKKYLESKYKSQEIQYLNLHFRPLSKEKVKTNYLNYISKNNFPQNEINREIKSQVVSCAVGDIEWDGGGSTNNWSEATNWAGNTVPISSNVVCFSSTSTKNAVVDTNVNVQGVKILPSYTGTISHTAGYSPVIGSGGFNQNGGTFTSTNSNLIVNGSFDQSGGTFTHNSGTVFVSGNNTVKATSQLNNLTVGNELVNFNDPFTATGVISTRAPSTGANWTLLSNIGGVTATAASNIVRPTASVNSGGAIYVANIGGNFDYPFANYDVSVTQTNGGIDDDPNWLFARIQSTGDLYAARWNENTLVGARLYKRVGGVWTLLSDCMSSSVADASTVAFRVSGSNLDLLDDGVSICSASDSSITGAGKAGLGFGSIGIPALNTEDVINTTNLDNFTVTYMVSSSPVTATLTSGLTLNGGVTIAPNSTLDTSMSNYDINLAGNWTNGGTFTPNQSTVTFTGTTQTVSGDNTFYNFVKNATSANTLNFEALKTQNITNSFTAMGSSSVNKLTLQSTLAGTQWMINIPSNRNISQLNVRDSNNIGANINAGDGTNTNVSNNTNWCFASCTNPSNISISGMVYAPNGFTPLTNKNVRLAVNGFDVGSTTLSSSANGSYSFSNVYVGTGTIFTIYLEDETENAVTVTVANPGTNLTGIDLVRNKLIIRNSAGGSTTSAQIITSAVSSEDDISDVFRANPSAITVNTGYELIIPTGNTFAPTIALDVNDIKVDGTLNIGANNLVVGGRLNSPSGTVTTTGTTIFKGSTSSVTAMSTLRNVSVGGQANIFLDNFTSATSQDLSVRTPSSIGNNWERLISVDGATFQAIGNTRSLSGGNSGGALYVANIDSMNSVYPTANYDITATQTNGGLTDDPCLIAGRIQSNGDMYVVKWNETTANGIDIYKKASGVWSLIMNCPGVAIMDASTVKFSLNGSTLDFQENNVSKCSVTDTSITSAGRAGFGFGNIGITGLSGDDVFDQRLDNFTVVGTYTSTSTLENNLALSGNLTVTSGSTLSVSPSDYGVTLTGNWTNNGTFTPFMNTVTLSGTNQTVSGNNTFYNLSKTIASASTLTLEAGKTQTIQNILTLRGLSSAVRLLLRSSLAGTQWNINPQGVRNINFLDVQDSNNQNATAINAGGANNLNSGNNTSWDFSAAGPTITSVTSSSANGTYMIGGMISIQTVFSEAVTVTGTPYLSLNSGSNAMATYASGSGTNTLSFSYTVSPGENSADLDYSSTSALNLNSGTIKSTATNANANTILATPGAAGSLGANKALVISTTATSTSISSPANGAMISGTVTISGVGPLGSNVQVLILNTGQGVTTQADASTGAWNVNLPTLAPGNYTITTITLDANGRPIGQSSIIDITVI